MISKCNKEAHEKAIELRKNGFSIKAIVKEIKKPISTVSLWVRHVELTPEQKRYLNLKNPANNNEIYRKKAVEKIKITWMTRRKNNQEEGRSICREAIKNKDIKFITGLVLYWAEGYRSNNRNMVRFCNTDIHMLKIFLDFIRIYFNVENKDITIRVYCWLNSNVYEAEKYWMDNLSLDQNSIRKAYVEQKRKISGKRKNTHTYGICNISINRTDIIQKIYGAIQEYIGVDKPEWLA